MTISATEISRRQEQSCRDLMSRRDSADFLGVSERTLDRIPQIPRVKIGERRIMFRRSDLVDYVAGRTETRTAA